MKGVKAMAKVLFVATVVKTHIMEFHIPYLKLFKDKGWQTAVAAKNDYDNPDDCKIPYCDEYFDLPFERTPIKFNNIKTYFALKKIIDKGNYDIIHCHTPMGGCIARIASKKARKKGTKVVYTAHGFHFYNGAPFINWFIYYPIERWLASKTDVIITINKEDYNRARSFNAKKVVYLPGVGIETKKFSKSQNYNINLKKELGIPNDKTVLLSVGELNKNKNHRVIIEALTHLNDCYYVICGRGPLLNEYLQLAETLGVKDRLIMTGYRNDVELFYKMADIFVFPSFREGLPIAVLEAMAAGLPIVASNIRGNRDLITNGENGFLVPKPNSREGFVDAIRKAKDLTINKELISKYDIRNVLNLINDIYFN